MKSMFDTGRAVFEPEEVAVLQVAADLALKYLEREGRPSELMTSKLGKVVVTTAQEHRRKGLVLDVEAIAVEAARFIGQLRALSLLN